MTHAAVAFLLLVAAGPVLAAGGPPMVVPPRAAPAGPGADALQGHRGRRRQLVSDRRGLRYCASRKGTPRAISRPRLTLDAVEGSGYTIGMKTVVSIPWRDASRDLGVSSTATRWRSTSPAT